ncbi:MAG: CoA pyrophosphatase [Planctomycetota bacterium]
MPTLPTTIDAMRSWLLDRMNFDEDAPDADVPISRTHRGQLSTARSALSPQLAYGRHRGPVRVHTRRAAVAVGLYRDAQRGWLIPLTRRPTTLRHHGGQICFPGGQIETGESPRAAAIREFTEELGIQPDIIADVGSLPRHYVFASDNLIDPVVLLIRQPSGPWQPDPVEVDQVIELPLAAIFDDVVIQTIRQRRTFIAPQSPHATAGELTFDAPAYRVDGRVIWGATAMILRHLVQRLRP